MDHRVDHLGVAHPRTEPGLGYQVRGFGHRLHATGNHHLDLARADQLVRQRDRVEAGEAHLVDGQRRHLLRDTSFDRGLPGGDLARAGLQHLAHDHVVHVFAFDPGPLEGGADGAGAQAHRRDFLECPAKLGDRGARAR